MLFVLYLLSENEDVSVKSLKFLRVFWNLQLLNVSSTAIAIGFQPFQVMSKVD